MKVTYKYFADDAYYKNVVDRYYRQRPIPFRPPVQFGILGLLISGYLMFTRNRSSSDAAIVSLLIGSAAFVTGVLLTKVGILFRLKRKAEFGGEVVVVISDGGVEASGRHTKGEWQWAAYPQSARFSDGILLMRAGAIRWLPDAAIQGGTREEATALVASKTVIRNIA